MEEPKTQLRMSVRELATAGDRRGHIDQFSGYRSSSSLVTGTLLHQKLQERLLVAEEQAYQKEVSLKGRFAGSDSSAEVQISGRLDGLFRYCHQIIVEEIKSTGSISRLREAMDKDPEHPYRLQALIYAHLFSLKEDSDLPVRVRLRLLSALSECEELYEVPWPEDWHDWFEKRIELVCGHHQKHLARLELRRATSEGLDFPFDNVREGQQDLISCVRACAEEGKHLLAEAPTGLGKTAGVMFPMLQQSLSLGRQLIYVTPKNSQHALALEVIRKLQDQGSKLNAVQLTAKKKICLQSEPLCTPDHCEFAKNYYDKVSEYKLLDRLQQEPVLDRELFTKYGESYRVCPFELSLEAAKNADVVVGDYNYVFSPNAAIMSLQMDEDGEPKKAGLLVDEAHNLPGRAQDYFSPELRQSQFDRLLEDQATARIPEGMRGRWKGIIHSCKKLIAHHKPKSFPPNSPDRLRIEIEEELFGEILQRIHAFTLNYFEQLESVLPEDPVMYLQGVWSDFCNALLHLEEYPCFASFRLLDPDQEESIKLTCLDASAHLAGVYKNFQCAILFSATLKPFEYFRSLGGLSELEHESKSFPSPFPPSHRKVLVIPQVATNYKERDSNYAKIADGISRIIRVHSGNYLAFFPSYYFMEKVAEHIDTSGIRLWKQERAMRSEQVDQLMSELVLPVLPTLVFGVQGGILSEGIDYRGDLAIGVFIVGPGLPRHEYERTEIRKYFDNKCGQGFEYAYVYPAMTKVVQSAGRVLRSEKDRGLIVLMDRRFLEPQYTNAFPSDWYEGSANELTSQSILRDLGEFWQTE